MITNTWIDSIEIEITVLSGCGRRVGAMCFVGMPGTEYIDNCHWTCCCRRWIRSCSLLRHRPPPTASLDADWRYLFLEMYLKTSIRYSFENITKRINELTGFLFDIHRFIVAWSSGRGRNSFGRSCSRRKLSFLLMTGSVGGCAISCCQVDQSIRASSMILDGVDSRRYWRVDRIHALVDCATGREELLCGCHG